MIPPIALAALLTLTLNMNAMAAESDPLEHSVCGIFKEPLAFWAWSRLAGEPDLEAAKRIPNAEPIEHKTRDDRQLKGYRLRSLLPETHGTVLVAQGNAMLADQLLIDLIPFSQAGMDIYVFDYRGYGRSEGKPRLKAILSDYRELYEHFVAPKPGPHHLYGISFGGIVLLNLVGSGISYDRVVIDSTPSRIAVFGCPERFDPIANLPTNASRFLFVAGGRDQVVPARDSQELRGLIKARGGQAELQPDWAHPFMDVDFQRHRDRLETIKAFLLGQTERSAQ